MSEKSDLSVHDHVPHLKTIPNWRVIQFHWFVTGPTFTRKKAFD